jgi:hypothetical protein
MYLLRLYIATTSYGLELLLLLSSRGSHCDCGRRGGANLQGKWFNLALNSSQISVKCFP